MELIAKENINAGDCVTKLYKRFCRRSLSKDFNLAGTAKRNYKKGELVDIINGFFTKN